MLYFINSLHLRLDCCKRFGRGCLSLSLKESLVFLGTRHFSVVWEMLNLLFKSSFLFIVRLVRLGWWAPFFQLLGVDKVNILVCLQGLKDLQLVKELRLWLGCELLRDVPLSLGETWSTIDSMLRMLTVCTSIAAYNLLLNHLLP